VRTALARHWPEYAIEAAGLGTFMLSACVFGTLLGHPGSPIVAAIGRPLALRALMGIAMAFTAFALARSPWGKRSGAHFNPALTVTFYRLGKMAATDAIFYVLAQFIGGLAGVVLANALLRGTLAHPAVHYVVTTGAYGPAVAFAAEATISFGLMGTVLVCTNVPGLNRFTAGAVACLVAIYITFESPLSGTSMNPARTLASALPAHSTGDAWIYFVAPALGMLAAAEVYARGGGIRHVLCAKLHHENAAPCIFRCEYPTEVALAAGGASVPRAPMLDVITRSMTAPARQ
jgi:aquaporin Z